MRKSKRILTSFLAIALVLSNLSLSTLTVNATEATDGLIAVEQEEVDFVDENELGSVSGNETGSVSQTKPGSETETGSVSQNETGSVSVSVSGNTPSTTPPTQGDTQTPDVPLNGKYNMSNLTLISNNDVIVVPNDDGSSTLTFNGNWKSQHIELPPELTGRSIDKVVFHVTSGNEGSFGYKTLTEEAYPYGATDVEYGKTTVITQEDTRTSLKYLAITSNHGADGNDTTPITMTISGITIESSEVDTSVVKPTVGTVNKVYSLGDLTQKAVSNVTATHNEASGSMKLDFTTQYGEADFEIPSDIDFSKVKKVSITLKSGSVNSLALKTYTQADWDAEGVYQTDVEYGQGSITPKTDVPNVKYIGISSTITGENSALIESITFTVEGSYTYTASILKEQGNNNVTVTENNGEEALAFAGQYNEIDYKVPADVEFSKVKKVIFNMNDGESQGLALKTYTQADWDAEGVYQTDADYSGTGVLVPSTDVADVKYLGISNNTTEAKNITLKSITFVFDEDSSVGVNPDAEESEGGVKLFTADDLTFSWADPDGEGIYEKKDGKWVVNFTGKQYAQVTFNLPESIDLANCTEVKFTVADQTVPIALKLWASDKEVLAEYGKTGAAEYVFVPNKTDKINRIGIMYGDGVPEEGYTVSLVSVAFTMKGSSDVTYGDNIIKNPNFADTTEAGLKVWNSAQGVSVISSEIATEAIFDDVTTYGKIARDDKSSTQDCFTQEITDAVEPGAEYKFEFYAMLSEDYNSYDGYEGDISDLCEVTFGPYGWKSDRINDYGGNEYWGSYNAGILSGDVAKKITPGEWTKFSGSFTIPNGEERVFIRIIEQGTNYGSGDCVKGDYYITGVSMKKVIKPETTVEENNLRWKDAITDAFGDDAIAGTCLGSNTITVEYLQELAKQHFNAITFENELKPQYTLGSTPSFDEQGNLKYNFSVADAMLKQIKEWNDENDADDIDFKVRGHVLVWHSQTPAWFFHEDYNTSKPYVKPEVMDQRLEQYIAAVFEHYKNSEYADMFYGWDVVNEAMSDATGKPRAIEEGPEGKPNDWASVYGTQSNEYIIKAFRYANKYAPKNIELYYNDYNDCSEPKASGIAQLVKDIKAAEGTRIDGVGMQAHHNFADPTASQIKSAINKYLDALGKGGTVQMTELDVKDSNEFDGSAASLKAEHEKQAWRFREIFNAYRDIEGEKPGSVGGITVWGITDETSWLRGSGSVGGASTDGEHAPLLFYTDNYVVKAKPAFYAFFDEKVDGLAPMIQSVTVMQQMKSDNFDIGNSYNVAGVAEFIPMWNKDGLTIKISVTDATDDGANDKVTVYVDTASSKSEGDYEVATVARNAAGVTSTVNGYETTITIPMSTAPATKFTMDVAVSDNGSVSIFNDKKETQDLTSQYYAEAIMKPYAEINKGTVTIDGEADAAWSKVDAIPLTIVKVDKAAEAAEVDATASVKALWDAENLYVYAEVKDAELDATGADVHEKDSVEVFIDENNAKAEAYQADDKQYRVNYLNEQTFKGDKCTAENIASEVKITDDGYVMEAAYKWTDITPTNGMEIGIEFQINDAKDGKRMGTVSWFDNSGQGWSSPRVFGTALLVDATSEPSTPSKPSQGGSGSSSSGSSSSSSSSSSTVKPEEKPVETPVVETPVTETPATGTSSAGATVNDAQAEETATETTVTESVIPEAVANVVEQVKTLVDADATPEEKVEAVQEVIDTVKELVQSEEVKELASETISSIEETIKEALGIDTKVDSKGDNVPEVKSVIGALLSVDAGKQPTLSVEALGEDNTPELEEGFVNAFPLEIKLFADDEEVQPNVPVTIRMGIPSGVDKDKEIKVVHFGQNGTDTLDTKVFGDEMEFTTPGFSTFVVVNVESATAGTELAPAEDNAAEEVADSDDTTVSAIEEKTEDNGFTTFIIIVIVVALLAVVAAGFFVLKNKKKE